MPTLPKSWLLLLSALFACSSERPGPLREVDGGQPDAGNSTPGAVIEHVAPPAADTKAFDALLQQVQEVEELDADGLRATYPVSFQAELGYDPGAASALDTIQSSLLALSDGELGGLSENGFVISTRREFPTFLRGLAEIYYEHLPVYITADALLEAVHRSYDAILTEFELKQLLPELDALLAGMLERLPGAQAEAAARADAELYLQVARGLLRGELPETRYADSTQVWNLIRLAEAAEGMQTVQLFGDDRDDDFSQFKPRGHYADSPELTRYFRAMIWLGRVDLRLIETQSDGSQRFQRAQYLAMLLLHELVAPDLERFEHIDEVIRTFVGESDYMVVPEVAKLVADLGGPAEARAKSDQEVAAAIVAGGYGKQQISSHLMTNDGSVKTLPLNRSFALLGQRYVADSQVFSEVVYDRIGGRMMPSPLDAAFAALGNDQALALHPELDEYSELPGALGRMRVLIDAHDQAFWDANFYNLWLSALRSLSPAPDAAGLPSLQRTEAWGRRVLNAQLGSWAELRHDTLLYAKQSYTLTPSCAFPDAYVDPYPEFYAALRKYAEAGRRLVDLASEPLLVSSMTTYFSALENAAAILGDMAERQLRGEPYTDAQLAFINDAVRVETQSGGCAITEMPDGWYADLFFHPLNSIQFDPTIADVHTQPSDAAGNPVGKVLHVGTGYPRLMVATVDTCSGPRAYAGVVYAYHEQITEDFQRLTDEEWAQRFQLGAPRPAEVPWLEGVLAK